ncbi:TraG family conjugative transposon ATPase [Mucilaginibacter paludis]|uniref:Conjugation system ATPase, TraG family n=1 Tax=Mucilaginibacter paludis DSM 18603 TaxID=714943 RepID=H1YHP2_9SPHI|nr:TraG family conjugative transposon ATPase [Mucilaginibacter paludis]EHQ26465.1 conjugation system ATPase, TraG family [Mucilaginibacter paludis DSM 18603]
MSAKQVFKLPYIGVDKSAEYHLLVGTGGECSVIIQITNPVLRYSAAPAAYDEFHGLLINIVKILGDGYILQKQDVFTQLDYPAKSADEYLQQQYNAHFEGRKYLQVSTYLTITRQVKKGTFYVYDKKVLRDMQQAVGKVLDILTAARAAPLVLEESAINTLLMRLLSMNFNNGPIVLDNLAPSDTELQMGERAIRNISLINIDSIDLPTEVGTHIELNDPEALRGFPVDFLSFLYRVPGFDTLVYNQVLEIPSQAMTLKKLELKKKRHSGIPDPANTLCVEDIDLLLSDVARENQLLVNCHFNIVISAGQGQIQKAVNFVESALFQLGIIPSKNAYNQLELFRSALPGNAVELKSYDWFLTTCDAAACFFFKESLPNDEPSDFLIRFTDRQGIPVGIDPADLPMRTGRINNRNKFVLGPSGSGKSFFMNALVEQYLLYNMDVVIVDVGHSYSGLCAYYNGKYITYSEEKPITMNPFAMNAGEYNIEKKDFLITLIALLWKGADGTISTIERDVLSNVINAYYIAKFQDHRPELNFNTFYEFALEKIPQIKQEERIPFDVDEFRYVLKKFYQGGEYQAILNEAADQSLFSERLIIYEIDNIQTNAILLPIVTLIIMDVFIQKMRHRKQQRKTLILEEAWRALASPIMANFLLYLNKTVRKFWGEIIEVTQELGDILGNPIVKDSIINNSDTVILLDQSKFKDNYNEIASLLSITETERKKIFTINKLDNQEGRGRFKEVYIRRGSVGEVYGVEVSLKQYLTYTTEKPEKSAVEIYAKTFGTYPAGLDAFVSDMQESKLSLGEFINRVNQAGTPIH